jgi:hypothetical protein
MSSGGMCPNGCQPGGDWLIYQGENLADVQADDPTVETYRDRMCQRCDHTAQIQATGTVPQDKRRRK